MISGLDANFEIAALVAWRHVLRQHDVPGVKRRMLEELSVFIDEPAGNLDVARRFNHKKKICLGSRTDNLINGSFRDDYVVGFSVRQTSELGEQVPRAFLNENDFVAITIAEKIAHGIFGCTDAY